MRTPIKVMTEGARIHNLDLSMYQELVKEAEYQDKIIHQQKEEIKVLREDNPNIKTYMVEGPTGWIQRLQEKECGYLICRDNNIEIVIDHMTSQMQGKIDREKQRIQQLKEEVQILNEIPWYQLRRRRLQANEINNIATKWNQ